MATLPIKTTTQVVPKCYAYTTPGVPAHDGWPTTNFRRTRSTTGPMPTSRKRNGIGTPRTNAKTLMPICRNCLFSPIRCQTLYAIA